MQNNTAMLEDSLVVSYKAKHSLTIRYRNHIPWYLLKWAENLYPHKNLCMNVCNNLNHNCQKMEATTRPSIGEWVNKLGISTE